MDKNNPRLLAVTILEKVAKQGSYSNLSLDAVLSKGQLEARDAHLLTNIVYGVIQHQLTLDWYLKPFVGNRKLDAWVKVLLESAVYQLEYLDKVPARAIFYDATEIAKRLGHAGIAKFVTAVLRNLQRTGVKDFATIKDPTERLSIASSTPRWLVDLLIQQQGREKTESILAGINQPANASLRVNTTKTNRAIVRQALAEHFEDIHDSEVSPDGLVAAGGFLAGAPEYAAGWYTIQDESSMLVAPALAVEPDSQVLDACAAPGGKTTHIAQFLDPQAGGKVTALDLHPHKVRLIAQNAARLGVADRVDAYAMDARDAGNQFAPESFDRILVDAPCSGLGLIRRKPEIKYEKSLEDIEHLPKIQGEILASMADLVQVDGRLVYSTCTMAQQENQQVVAAFLAAHPNFEQIKTPGKDRLAKSHGDLELQLFPDDYGTDGFFIAAMRRVR